MSTTIDETREIPLEEIFMSPTNPRRSFSEAALEELAESIRAHGVVQAVLVRPVGERFELVCGERRVRASRLAGLSSIAARVRELSDRDVLEIQLIENSQREDVHPLEEARALRGLHDEHGYSVEELAAKLGRPVAFVYRRLALCGLSEESQIALDRGAISIGVAELLARLYPEQQEQVLANFTGDRDYQGYEPPTVSEVRSYIRWHIAKRLATVPWDASSPTLVPEAGACTACPKRSSAQRDLFGEPGEDDRCLDSACFERKREAHWSLAEAEARARGAEPLDLEESRKIFRHGPHYLSDRSYIQLDDECAPIAARVADDTTPIPTWREVLGDRAVRELFCNVEGHPVAVARLDEVLATLEASPRDGDPESDAVSAEDDSKWQLEAEKRRKADELNREVENRIRLEVIRAVESEFDEDVVGVVDSEAHRFFVLLTKAALDVTWGETSRRVAKRRGAADAKELAAALAEAPASTVIGVLAEALLTQHAGTHVRELATLLEVDEKAIRKAARADLKAKEKAKSARAEKRRAKKAAEEGASA